MPTQDKPQTKNATQNTTASQSRQDNNPSKSTNRIDQDSRSGSMKSEPYQSDRKVSNY